MARVDRGNQQVFVNFKQELTSELFNQQYRGILKPGIYTGANLSTDGNNLKISPFTALFYSKVFGTSTDKLAVVVKTESQVVLDGSEFIEPTKTILAMKYEWRNAFQNYIDFYVRQPSDPAEDNEIILGSIEYSGITVTGFTIHNRTYGLYDESSNSMNLPNTRLFREASDTNWEAITIQDSGDWNLRENKHSGIVAKTDIEKIGGIGFTKEGTKGYIDIHSLFDTTEKTDTDITMRIGNGIVSVFGSLSADNLARNALFTGLDDLSTYPVSSMVSYQRNLTTALYNNITGCSLASRKITIPSGTYIVTVKILAGSELKGSSIALYNDTDSSVLLSAPVLNETLENISFTGIIELLNTKEVYLTSTTSIFELPSEVLESCQILLERLF